MNSAIMTYELLERMLGISHSTAKFIHFILQTIAIVIITIALFVVVHFKDQTGNDHLYTAHAVIGLFVYIATGIQWLLGLIFYLAPVKLRTFFKPWHVWFGISVFVGSGAAIVTGILSRQWIFGAFYVYESVTGKNTNVWMLGGSLAMVVLASVWLTLSYFVRQKIVSQQSEQEYTNYKSMETPN